MFFPCTRRSWRGIEDGSVLPSRQNLMELGSEALATLRNSLMRNLWLCPLTNMLPVDPVRAEDGNVYERRAIHGWIYEAQFLAPPRLCSPVTGKPMGSRLTSCFEVRADLSSSTSHCFSAQTAPPLTGAQFHRPPRASRMAGGSCC